MKKLVLILILLSVFPISVFAYSSNICKTDNAVCTKSEVGVFMANISKLCGNAGDCTLEDIMTVIVNIGNFVVGIIGAVVLGMYVVGGFYFLASAGEPERVKKGKTFLKTSTIGLLIVMFSYLGIFALRNVLHYGAVATTRPVGEEYVVCTGGSTLKKPCDLNMTCTANGLCVSTCEQDHPDLVDDTPTTFKRYECIDRNTTPTSNQNNTWPWYNSAQCETNKCPGSSSVQCCVVERLK